MRLKPPCDIEGRVEGDLHFSGLKEKETREDGHLFALNELCLCVSNSARGASHSPVHAQDVRGKQGGKGDDLCWRQTDPAR